MIFHIEKVPRKLKFEPKEETNKFYRQIEKLGKGTYGSVYKVIDNETQQIFALKRILFLDQHEGIPVDVLREITFLSQINHPNLLNIYKYLLFPDKIEMFIDYCQTDLKHFIAFGTYTEKTVKLLIYQIILGISCLHSHLIMHRDLKPGNIFLNTDTMEIKIGDFGLSRKIDFFARPYTLEVSTLGYRAPELIMQSNYYLNGIDTWSIGCILAEMITKQCLIEGNNELEQLVKMRELFGNFTFANSSGIQLIPNDNDIGGKHVTNITQYIKDKAIVDVSDDCYDLIEQMLVIDPNKRICLKDALEHVSYFKFNFLTVFRNGSNELEEKNIFSFFFQLFLFKSNGVSSS